MNSTFFYFWKGLLKLLWEVSMDIFTNLWYFCYFIAVFLQSREQSSKVANFRKKGHDFVYRFQPRLALVL